VEQTPPGRFVLYSIFRAAQHYPALPKDEKSRAIAEYLAAVDDYASRLTIRAYSTLGLRRDADFVLWVIGDRLDDVQELMERLRKTGLAPHLENTYSYFAVTRESVYVKSHPEGEAPVTVESGRTDYLFVYPFVKTREWYLLPMEQRRKMMIDHIRAGHTFPSIRINTAYSFGIDDQDFVVAFEGNDPREFVTLLMQLRETEASRYTVRDTPQFTARRRPLERILQSLG
jgi:chlorite dismutase